MLGAERKVSQLSLPFTYLDLLFSEPGLNASNDGSRDSHGSRTDRHDGFRVHIRRLSHVNLVTVARPRPMCQNSGSEYRRLAVRLARPCMAVGAGR